MKDKDLPEPSLNINLAAKTRASVVEEGEAGFDMREWYHSNCQTTACLAGHAVLCDGGDPEEYTGLYGKSWSNEAIKKLFNLPEECKPFFDYPELDSSLGALFIKTDTDREEIIEEFDSLVQSHTSEEEFVLYLQKSYGYQGHYQKERERRG